MQSSAFLGKVAHNGAILYSTAKMSNRCKGDVINCTDKEEELSAYDGRSAIQKVRVPVFHLIPPEAKESRLKSFAKSLTFAAYRRA